MKQEEKSRLSRENIIKAALIEFTEMGFEHASLNRICRENQISKGKFYHHFNSKDELLLACCAWVYDTADSYVCIEDLNFDGSMEEKIHIIFVNRMKVLLESPYIAGLWFARLTPPAHLKQQVVDIRLKSYQHVSTLMNHVFHQSGLYDANNVPIYQEMFVIASTRTQERMLQEWNPAASFERHKELLDAAAARFDQIIHIFLYGILAQRKEPSASTDNKNI